MIVPDPTVHPSGSPSGPGPRAANPARARRNQLVEDHLDDVETFVRRYAGRGVERDELRQVAFLALVQAADRFDPDRGVEFRTFASATIDGSIKRYFRDHTWTVRPPRALQELHLHVREADDELTRTLGRRPTLEELATTVGTDVESVHVAMEASMAHRSSSSTVPVSRFGEPSLEPAWLGIPERGYERIELLSALRVAVQRLDERDRWIIWMRFVENQSQDRISQDLGVSQSYVSRMLVRSLDRLRALLLEESRP